jgi:hypothetical protein
MKTRMATRAGSIAAAVAIAAGTLTTAGAVPATAAAGSAPSATARCPQSYPSAGPGESITHKGAGDRRYAYGKTKFRGRTIVLKTGRYYDRSSGAIIKGRRGGDKVWVDITGNRGRSWQKCGVRSGKQTPWFQHGTVRGRWMRVCIKVRSVAKPKCAHVGNKTGPGNRKWWSDS